MTYSGPDRRTLPDDFHDQLAALLREVTGAEVTRAIAPLEGQVARLSRLIEGENGGRTLNAGILGAIAGLESTDGKLEARVIGLERRWDRLRWTVGAFALGGGLGGGSLVAWLTNGGL